MKYAVAAVAIVISAASVAHSDTLVMKDGKSYEWRAIVDQGDAYQLELASGAKVVVKKADVLKFGITDSGGPLAGAAFERLKGKTRTMNALGFVDLKRDVFTGAESSIKWRGSGLACNFHTDRPERIQIQHKISEEYDFTIVAERQVGISDFYIGLVGGGNPFMLHFDAEKMSSSGMVGGAGMKANGNTALFPERKPVTVLCQVRKTGVKVSVDGKEFLSWTGAWGSTAVPSSHALPDGKAYPFFGSQKIFGTPTNTWVVHKVVITETE